MLFKKRKKDMLESLIEDAMMAYRNLLSQYRKDKITREQFYLLLLSTSELVLSALLGYGNTDEQLKNILKTIIDKGSENTGDKGGSDGNEKKAYL